MDRRQLLYERQKRRLDAFREAQPSFDRSRIDEYTAADGWHVDNYERVLPPEVPGLPAPGGSFRAAQEVLRSYSFPPPDLITGIFAPDTALEDRVMVLRGRFLVFTFWFGVRIGQVIDEIRSHADGTREAVWGYSYYTLEGHFEQGEIIFTVHKNLDTGQVTFRIHAVSRTGHIDNLLYRLGFRIFGRGLQRRFAYGSMDRLEEQVSDMQRTGQTTPPPSQTPVQPVSQEDLPENMQDRIEETAKTAREPGPQG